MKTLNKKTIHGVLLGTVLGVSVLAASMAIAGPSHGGHQRGGDPAAMTARKLGAAVQRLDLDDAQETAIRKIFEDNRDALRAHGEASRTLRQELQTLMSSGTADEAELAALAEQEGELAEERVMLMGSLALSVQAELTEEQRAELAAMREERSAQRRERRGVRGNRNQQQN